MHTFFRSNAECLHFSKSCKKKMSGILIPIFFFIRFIAPLISHCNILGLRVAVVFIYQGMHLLQMQLLLVVGCCFHVIVVIAVVTMRQLMLVLFVGRIWHDTIDIRMLSMEMSFVDVADLIDVVYVCCVSVWHNNN